MKLKDSVKLSVNSIMNRRLRSWLTLLGIIIGVAAVVAIISIGEGAQASVTERLSGLGADIITVSPGFERTMGFGGGFRMERGIPERVSGSSAENEPALTKMDATVIRGNPNILCVNEIVSGRGGLVFIAEKTNVSVEGVNPNTWQETSNLELASGRFLTPSDSAAIVISGRLANSTFKQPITLGRRITIEDKPFTVVGILEESGEGPSFGGGGGGNVYMNYTSAWEVTGVEKNTFSSIQLKAASAELVEQVTEEIKQDLMLSRKVTSDSQDFTVTSSQAMQEQITATTETLTLFLAAIAAVSLLVGAVGIANSMFTSVLEKTREIGILKALGSTNNEILRLFVIESGLFGLVGGIIGVIIGALASLALSGLGILALPMVRGGLNTFVSPQLVIIAIVLSTAIGIVSGILPARAAAKLKPVEALRYE